MIICKGEMKFSCDSCGHINTLDSSDLDFEIQQTEDREMGNENMWVASIEIGCENCDAEMEITHSVWEYPSISKSHEEVTVDNGKLISQCDTSFKP